MLFSKLFPKDSIFFNFFAQHAALVVKASQALLQFQIKEIKAFEEEADGLTRQCVETLHKTFITPIERSDIYRLISTMDDVIDEICAVAKFLQLYNLKSHHPDFLNCVQVIVSASLEIESAVIELEKRKNTDAIQNNFLNIKMLEQKGDVLYMEALKHLYDEEKDVLTIIKWKEIYDHLESAINACDDVANILEGIILENE